MSSPAAASPIRIAFVLGELTIGGAEMMLWKLVSRIDRSRFEPLVVALSSKSDELLERFEASGTPCVLLGMKSRMDVPALLRLLKVLREFAPGILQGWMYYGNLAATCASFLIRRRPAVLWGIRGSLNLSQEKRLSVLAIRLSGKVSRLPHKVINNSAVSALEHERQLGYCASNRVIVPNGFDTAVFKPSLTARAELRTALGVPRETLLVGLIARYHPMKDHAGFLQAAELIAGRYPDVHYVLAGENTDACNLSLREAIGARGLAHRVHLLGLRKDIAGVTAALDVAVSSSCGGEGFSNAIGEAMSCGVPCVTTDVGDGPYIVGSTGKVVRARDPRALAQAVAYLIEVGASQRTALGRRARKRIAENFSLDTVVRQYEALYTAVHDESAV